MLTLKLLSDRQGRAASTNATYGRRAAQRADPIDNRTSGRTTVRSADGRRAYARPTNIVTTRKRLIFPIERTLARVLLLQE
jgi:hypothetical protein